MNKNDHFLRIKDLSEFTSVEYFLIGICTVSE